MQREAPKTPQIERLITYIDPQLADKQKTSLITIALIDHRPLTLASFSTFIQNAEDSYLVVPFESAERLIHFTNDRQEYFHILIYNIGPEQISNELFHKNILHLKQYFNDIPLVLVADCESAASITQAFNLGVQGYISTALMPTVVMAAIQLVLEGGLFAPFKSLFMDCDQQQSQSKTSAAMADEQVYPDTIYLTPRQLEVIEHVKLGEPNKIISDKLGMQECTVKVHIRDIMRKLKATNRTQLVYNAQQQILSV